MKETFLLLTIAFSHFNEKARWAFSYYGVPYTQHLLLPGFHILSVKPFTGFRKSESLAANASSIYSTPCLLIYDKDSRQVRQLLQESSDIIRYLSDNYSAPDKPNLYHSCGTGQENAIIALVKHYDETLGVAARTYTYYDMLAVNRWRALIPFAVVGFRNNVGFLQSTLWALITPLIIALFNGSRDKYEEAANICRDEFEAASLLLQSSPYLAGDHLSAADITFAALSYPILGVTHEEGYQQYPPARTVSSDRAKDLHKSLRATKAGQHVLRLFKEERILGAVLPTQKKTLFGLW